MSVTPVLASELLSRLERLAEVRHTDRDVLLYEAICAYLDREEAQREQSLPTPPRRVPGGDEGKIFIAPDFNAPLPAEIEDLFYR